MLKDFLFHEPVHGTESHYPGRTFRKLVQYFIKSNAHFEAGGQIKPDCDRAIIPLGALMVNTAVLHFSVVCLFHFSIDLGLIYLVQNSVQISVQFLCNS